MTSLPAFAVHRLSSADIGLTRRLNAMFGDVFDDPETYKASPPSDRYLARVLGDEAFVVLAALEGERVIGGLVAYVLRKFERERSEAYIYNLAVVLGPPASGSCHSARAGSFSDRCSARCLGHLRSSRHWRRASDRVLF